MSFLLSSMFFLIDKIDDLKSHPFTTLHLNPGCFKMFQHLVDAILNIRVLVQGLHIIRIIFRTFLWRTSSPKIWRQHLTAQHRRSGTLKLSKIPRARREMKSTHTTRGADVWRLPGTNDRINPTNAGSKILVFSVNECKWVPGRLHHITPHMETCP